MAEPWSVEQAAKALCGCRECGGDRHEAVCWIEPITRGLKAGLTRAAEICSHYCGDGNDGERAIRELAK